MVTSQISPLPEPLGVVAQLRGRRGSSGLRGDR